MADKLADMINREELFTQRTSHRPYGGEYLTLKGNRPADAVIGQAKRQTDAAIDADTEERNANLDIDIGGINRRLRSYKLGGKVPGVRHYECKTISCKG